MNILQQPKQLRYLFEASVWAEGLAEPHFGKVICTTRRDNAIAELGGITPGVIIRFAGATPDREHPQKSLANWELELVCCVPEDGYAQGPLIGASTVSGSSAGRGVLEMVEYLWAALGIQMDTAQGRSTVGDVSGFTIVGWAANYGAASVDQQHAVGVLPCTLTTVATLGRYYTPIRRITATGGAGSVSLSWTNPALRFDSYQIILRRASGATPPSSATSGTGVTLASNWATSVTDTIAAGTYSYAAFVSYDETNLVPATAQRYSIAATAASVVVS